MIEAKNNILMISGPSPGVGKSFVSSNLAAVIAESGQRVLLIDGDMRKGYLHKLMNTKQQDGLSDLLSGRIALNDAIKKTEVGSLDFVSCGQFPPNPSETADEPEIHHRAEEIQRAVRHRDHRHPADPGGDRGRHHRQPRR